MAPSCRSEMTHSTDVNELIFSRLGSWMHEMLLLTWSLVLKSTTTARLTCKTASKSRTPCCYFSFVQEKYDLINRVKNKRALSGALVVPGAGSYSALLGEVWWMCGDWQGPCWCFFSSTIKSCYNNSAGRRDCVHPHFTCCNTKSSTST